MWRRTDAKRTWHEEVFRSPIDVRAVSNLIGHDLPVAAATTRSIPEASPDSVQKASCGAGRQARDGAAGQVPAAHARAGFKGFNCNLELVGAEPERRRKLAGGRFEEAGNCIYYDTSSATANRTHLGVVVMTPPTPPRRRRRRR